MFVLSPILIILIFALAIPSEGFKEMQNISVGISPGPSPV
jgi:hypothetical protein